MAIGSSEVGIRRMNKSEEPPSQTRHQAARSACLSVYVCVGPCVSVSVPSVCFEPARGNPPFDVEHSPRQNCYRA